MEKSYIIREAGIEDLDLVLKYRLEFLKELGFIASEDEYNDMYSKSKEYFIENIRSRNTLVWFMENQNLIVCTGAVLFIRRAPVSIDKSRDDAYIFNIYTLPKYRKKGFATVMMRHILEEIKKYPCDRVWLHASDTGRSVYRKLGFFDRQDVMEKAVV